ncbi:Secreted hemolysin-type calcium-binding protein [Neofusicoccum parvum]|uniref:AA1-like domain-containing protein n=1 Tax=Botryosphaeria parva (strain UCR-NP2) TaxID=1287680 RepID=R1ECG8_BOTPV|nr:hypothetical protein UCRNP2_8131 [Neofusicoccum parvum UCRNP2]GME44315.1 Secreted hemolysin-type calcium-binding protein [Neofusicoccum parvum]
MLIRILTLVGAAAALAAPAPQAGTGSESPTLNSTKPFEIERLYMSMDSVWDTSTGTDVKISITDPNSGVSTICDTSDVLANTVYSCERDQTSWTFNYDFSKLSIEWAWELGEFVPDSETHYIGNGTAAVSWNCASSGSNGQQCFANNFNVPVQKLSAWRVGR